MSAAIIQLTTTSPEKIDVWVNPQHIICFYASTDHKGSEIAIVEAPDVMHVKESPSDIVEKITGWSKA